MNIRNIPKYPSLFAEVNATTREAVMKELENFPSYSVRVFVVGDRLCGQFRDKLFDKNQGYDISMLYSNPNEWVRMQASLHGMNVFDNRRVGGLSLANITPHGQLPKVVMEFCGVKSINQLNALAKAGNRSLGNRVKYVCVCGNSDEEEGTNNAEAEAEIKAEIRKMKNDNDTRALHILSIGMGSRSFSVSEIEVNILGFDGGSENTVGQKAPRVLTEGKLWNGEPKKVGVTVILAIDSNREKEKISVLHKLILSEAIAMKGEDKSVTIREGVINTLSAWDIQLMDTEEIDGTFNSIDPNEILTQDNVRRIYQDVARGCFDGSIVVAGEDEIFEEMANGFKSPTTKSPRQLPKNKKNTGKEGEGNGQSRENDARESNMFKAYERIIGSVSNVYLSFLGIAGDHNKMPKTYLECLDLFPKNDAEIIEILGTNPYNVKKLVSVGALGLREDFLNEIYLSHNE